MSLTAQIAANALEDHTAQIVIAAGGAAATILATIIGAGLAVGRARRESTGQHTELVTRLDERHNALGDKLDDLDQRNTAVHTELGALIATELRYRRRRSTRKSLW